MTLIAELKTKIDQLRKEIAETEQKMRTAEECKDALRFLEYKTMLEFLKQDLQSLEERLATSITQTRESLPQAAEALNETVSKLNKKIEKFVEALKQLANFEPILKDAVGLRARRRHLLDSAREIGIEVDIANLNLSGFLEDMLKLLEIIREKLMAWRV
ncbi:MAG: gp58-like family protein [Aigarchaeota archaeon]|nr:gp58-like family protein [Aigarchaeota archaeon]